MISASCFFAMSGIFMLKKNNNGWQRSEVPALERIYAEQPKLTELARLDFKRN